MNWQSLFTHGKEITPAQAREYIRSLPTEDIQLIDVRQPKEYQEAHIPGAVLIPLNELQGRIAEIDASKNTIVYCRSGNRSNAACQLLREAGRHNILNLQGGMLQWQGNRVAGEENMGLEFFIQGDFSSATAMAYSMEAGLKEFYLYAAGRTPDPGGREFLEAMARLEDGHMARLKAKYDLGGDDLAQRKTPGVLEGGFKAGDIAETFSAHLDSRESIIQLAMMFEAQALDLYSRLAAGQDNPDLQKFFRHMAGEEQHHLNTLAAELDRLLT